MANLKEFRNKIGVIQSTRKVTSAMRLVAGVKLKKAEGNALASRDYALELMQIISRIDGASLDVNYELFSGRDCINTEMMVIFASDKGLCGNFNYTINKEVACAISEIHAKGRRLHLICIGAKLFEAFKHVIYENDVIEPIGGFYNEKKLFDNSQKLAKKIVDDFISNRVDKISVAYMKSYSVMQRKVEIKSIVPVICESNAENLAATIFEPSVEEILETIVPYNIAVQIYQSALESIASEQGSRMISMDNATKNADDLLSNLTVKYNRTRQYGITQELVEVVSGAAIVRR